MQHLEVRGAVRHIYVIRRLKVKQTHHFAGDRNTDFMNSKT